jgi:uncharacterized membrane protein YdjX (TVP38/TMEM64 family)
MYRSWFIFGHVKETHVCCVPQYASLCLDASHVQIAPLPLYSTLITLSGYTFGPWIGAVISYCAALSGAVVVFWLSRTFLRETISRWLTSTRGLCRAVRAVERRPQLLFFVRLAPYPYNVLNALLAATPTLTMRTYVICTGLSLFKVIVHTSIGAGIRSFSAEKAGDQEEEDDTWSRVWTIAGILLCIALFVYLSWVARRAVDDELDDDSEFPGSAAEERVAFLTAESPADDDDARSRPLELPQTLRNDMTEAELVPHGLVSPQRIPSGVAAV